VIVNGMWNRNWQEAHQLAIYKRVQGVECGTGTLKNIFFSEVTDVFTWKRALKAWLDNS